LAEGIIMLTKEQSKEILLLANSYASWHAINEVAFENTGHVSSAMKKCETDAWERLKGCVEGLVKEE
jgi:hypothetical protein